jgi:hypothetical protein
MPLNLARSLKRTADAAQPPECRLPRRPARGEADHPMDECVADLGGRNRAHGKAARSTTREAGGDAQREMGISSGAIYTSSKLGAGMITVKNQ